MISLTNHHLWGCVVVRSWWNLPRYWMSGFSLQLEPQADQAPTTFVGSFPAIPTSLARGLDEIMFQMEQGTMSGWWLSHPSEKYGSSVGMIFPFPIYGNITFMFQTTNHVLWAFFDQVNGLIHGIPIDIYRLSLEAIVKFWCHLADLPAM